jgi:cell wall-associated NlpC family hydrolase
MKNRNTFFCFLAASLFVVSFAFNASAQTRDRKVITNSTETTTTSKGESRLQNEPVIISEAEPEEVPKTKTPALLSQSLFSQLLQAAIDARIGARYRYGSQGPRTFDCSGFVWSVFQEVGINFERGSARTLWARYQAPTEEEKYKFGTLVFFNRLGHVGIVVDENGFYHASTSKGVMYSRFDDYWTKRLVGFRRIPLTAATETTAKK